MFDLTILWLSLNVSSSLSFTIFTSMIVIHSNQCKFQTMYLYSMLKQGISWCHKSDYSIQRRKIKNMCQHKRPRCGRGPPGRNWTSASHPDLWSLWTGTPKTSRRYPSRVASGSWALEVEEYATVSWVTTWSSNCIWDRARCKFTETQQKSWDHLEAVKGKHPRTYASWKTSHFHWCIEKDLGHAKSLQIVENSQLASQLAQLLLDVRSITSIPTVGGLTIAIGPNWQIHYDLNLICSSFGKATIYTSSTLVQHLFHQRKHWSSHKKSQKSFFSSSGSSLPSARNQRCCNARPPALCRVRKESQPDWGCDFGL